MSVLFQDWVRLTKLVDYDMSGVSYIRVFREGGAVRDRRVLVRLFVLSFMETLHAGFSSGRLVTLAAICDLRGVFPLC